MDSKVKSAVGELETLFSTKAKGTTVYFNEFNYTPIPQPVTEAVKLIMSDYPELKYRIGLYSVTVLDTDKKKIANALNKTPVKSETQMGKLHDDFVQAKISESELKDILSSNDTFEFVKQLIKSKRVYESAEWKIRSIYDNGEVRELVWDVSELNKLEFE